MSPVRQYVLSKTQKILIAKSLYWARPGVFLGHWRLCGSALSNVSGSSNEERRNGVYSELDLSLLANRCLDEALEVFLEIDESESDFDIWRKEASLNELVKACKTDRTKGHVQKRALLALSECHATSKPWCASARCFATTATYRPASTIMIEPWRCRLVTLSC